jgi:hypothetical protein
MFNATAPRSVSVRASCGLFSKASMPQVYRRGESFVETGAPYLDSEMWDIRAPREPLPPIPPPVRD